MGVYPGEDWCDPSADAPHAKWHLETGIGLADWAHLADLYYQVGTSIIFVQFRYSFVTVSFSRSYLRQMNKQMILQKKTAQRQQQHIWPKKWYFRFTISSSAALLIVVSKYIKNLESYTWRRIYKSNRYISLPAPRAASRSGACAGRLPWPQALSIRGSGCTSPTPRWGGRGPLRFSPTCLNIYLCFFVRNLSVSFVNLPTIPVLDRLSDWMDREGGVLARQLLKKTFSH